LSAEQLPASVDSNPARQTRRTADILVDVLADSGVDVIFGLPGGTIAPIFDALLDRPEIRVVTTKHEAGAMFAAAGYARTTGKLGVVLVTSGPGVTNAMTGLASAWCDGIPLLLLAGEVPRKVYGKGALQEGSSYNLDILKMTSSVSKLSIEAFEPNAAPGMLRRAIATAMSGRRGPVVVTVPIDVSGAAIAESDITVDVATRFRIPDSALLRAKDALIGPRTVIFAGSGCRQGSGPQRLREVAERLQCPVMTTPKGKGVFPEDHPLSLGVYGFGGHPSALDYANEGIDSMLAIGTSLGDLATNGWSAKLKPAQNLVHVDIDVSRIGRSYAATQAIAAPAEEFLAQILEVLPEPTHRGWYGVRTFTDASEVGDGPEGFVSPQRAIWEIQRSLGRDAAFTVDSGEHFLWATHYLRIHHPDAFFVMTGLGSMGTSIGAAMGIQMACPKRPVAAICGDGCFAMSATEIATAVEARIPIHVFVINDRRLGMVEMGNTAIYGRTPGYEIPTIDVPKLAESLGARALVAEHTFDILRLPLYDVHDRRPVVIDVRIDRAVKMPKHGRFEALGNAAGRRLREVK